MKAYIIRSGGLYCVFIDIVVARKAAEEIAWGDWKPEIEEVDLPEEIAVALSGSPLNGQYEKSFEEEYQLVLDYPWKGQEEA